MWVDSTVQLPPWWGKNRKYFSDECIGGTGVPCYAKSNCPHKLRDQFTFYRNVALDVVDVHGKDCVFAGGLFQLPGNFTQTERYVQAV